MRIPAHSVISNPTNKPDVKVEVVPPEPPFFGKSFPVLETSRYRTFEGLTALASKETGAWDNLAQRLKKMEALFGSSQENQSS